MACLNPNKKDTFLTSHWYDLCSPQQELSHNKNFVNNQTEHRKPLEVKGDPNGESARAKRAESVTTVLETSKECAEEGGRQPHVNSVHSTRVWVCGLFIEQSERDR